MTKIMLASASSYDKMPSTMKITAFNGSPRGEKSNTNIMVEAFLEGARSAGAETENIFLVKKTVKHCLGCFACWTKTPGKCVQKDDMAELLQKFIESDIVIFATPLYVDNVSGILKNFIDRFIPLVDPRFEKDSGGECRHLKRYEKYPKYVVISNCGFPERTHFQTLQLIFRRMARNAGSEIIAEIYRDGGEVLRNDSILLKPLLWKYKNTLKKAGREVATEFKISEATQLELDKPIISPKTYTEHANKSFDKKLKEIL